MESKMTAVEWFYQRILAKDIKEVFEQAKAMEREQHGETWDAALIHVDKRGGVVLRALVDFDEYWAEKRNTPDSEGVSQPGLPEGRN